jgi:hypothetical protein
LWVYKRLRARRPDLEVVVGVWNASLEAQRVRAQSEPGAAPRAVTSLAEALSYLCGAAERLSLARKVRPQAS